jgi:hypothetical protein
MIAIQRPAVVRRVLLENNTLPLACRGDDLEEEEEDGVEAAVMRHGAEVTASAGLDDSDTDDVEAGSEVEQEI